MKCVENLALSSEVPSFVNDWRALQDSNFVLPFFKSALYARSAIPCRAQ